MAIFGELACARRKALSSHELRNGTYPKPLEKASKRLAILGDLSPDL
jgi:hypothetical protein